MLTDKQIIKLLFGFKMRYLRQQAEFSYQELAKKTGLSTSYLSDIEKGKRYPMPDKITALARAFEVDYNYMVSTNASKKLQPIIDLVNSKFFRFFPLKEFGLDLEKLLDLFSNTPDRTNAFISTLFKMARNYQIGEEQFYMESLRSYQDMHNNYFPKLEEAVKDFRATNAVKGTVPYTSPFLEKKLSELYDIKVDREHLKAQPNLSHVRSYFNKKKKTLYLQGGLRVEQENFLLARELGFQFLKLKIRPFETTIIEKDSFAKLLNNYKASHFAAALLMEEDKLVADIRAIVRENTWQPELFSQLLQRYKVSPETLMQRLTNIFPHHFGVEDLFFIRLSGTQDLKSFKMTKDLHLAHLHNPYNNELQEHYCNRWVSITSIKELRFQKKKKRQDALLVDAQISKYWGTDKEYLCISIAKPTFNHPERGTSVTLGLLVNPHLKSIFHFLSDPALKYKEVHTTCERCGIVDCTARVAPPVVIEQQEQQEDILETLKDL